MKLTPMLSDYSSIYIPH